ncbi:MAG: NUDIX domain-containing protein [Gammaproteobacteria bacterium]|nr:NUDIX domain-containing protein [Gammaproteobacteria bacterium]
MPEYFETFDDDDNPTGLVARNEVHARGLWHRSAHVFLFTSDHELYVQRRAADKDLYPGRWDFSVGEHLKPGETYLAGAQRGLAEELGVSGVALQPIGTLHRATNRIPELGVADREIQQAFSGCYDGPVRPDREEVAEVTFLPVDALRRWMARSPEAFTPWFLDEVTRLGLLRPA